jgi:diguanylate cyclase (GGDEF)-like protein
MTVRPTVLVVDDDATNLFALSEILEPDYTILVAKSGAEALRLVREGHVPDLILLDIEMPEMNGFDVLAAMRADTCVAGVPVIFVSARSAEVDEEQGLALGAVDYIAKPIQAGVVRARVRTHLENKAARDILRDRSDLLFDDLLRAQRVGRIGSWKLDLASQQLEWSPETYRLFEVDPSVPMRLDAFIQEVHPLDRERVTQAWEAALGGEPYDIEHRTTRSDGRIWVREVAEFGAWENGRATVALGTVQDVTERRLHAEQLERLAYQDPLTGVANRHAFFLHLEEALRGLSGAEEVILHQIDLDGLARVNTTMGSSVGDVVIQTVAERLLTCVETRERVARMGGDQFVVAMTSLDGAESVHEQVGRIQRLVEEPMDVNGETIRMTACIGSVHNRGHQVRNPGQLVRMVDQAIYQAKLSGKARNVEFELAKYESDRVLHERLDAIRVGLAERQFVLYYQPKVDLRSGSLVGFEALVRWQHPSRGLVSPNEFVPYLEGHPLMLQLGDWVLVQALDELRQWELSGLTTNVSVNVAGNQLDHPSFPHSLQAVLQARPWLDPSRLELEVLETGPMFQLDHATVAVERIKELGVAISLDDFGTGHSSLQTLVALRPNVLKVDRSFILGMDRDARSLAVVQAIIGLGATFQVPVLAEGVETREQARTLVRLGCALGQGYGIGRPMPSAAVRDWYNDWQKMHRAWLQGDDERSG